MPLITRYYDFAQITKGLITTNAGSLGIQQVYYGDQRRIPVTPAVCVEPGGKDRQLNGLPRKTEITLTCYVLVYLYKLGSPEDIREADDVLAENIEVVLHADNRLPDGGGIPRVIDSLVTNIESGWQQKANSLFRASRLTFEATSQEILPSAP